MPLPQNTFAPKNKTKGLFDKTKALMSKRKPEQSFCYAPSRECGCILSIQFFSGNSSRGWRRRKYAGIIHIPGCICHFALGFCKNIKKRTETLYQSFSPYLRNDRENNTIRGFRFLVELSFGIWCSWVQSGCKTRRIWCTHSFRFAVISERTMARGRKKKFSDYIRTEVARIYRLLHNVGTLRRVPIFHFGCIFIGLTFLCP